MSNADPTTPNPAQDQASSIQGPPSYSTHLIILIRGLISYGQNLLTTLRTRNEPPETPASADLAMFFGTARVALIIARITRGLMFAGLLERRVQRSASRLDNPRPGPVARPEQPAKRGPRIVHPKPVTDDAALLERLPTEQEIAARLRNRSIGDVIIDICRDLGIPGSHPLWRQLQTAVLRHSGNPARLLRDLVTRARAHRWRPPDLVGDPASAPLSLPLPAAGTGPPSSGRPDRVALADPRHNAPDSRHWPTGLVMPALPA